MVLVAETPKLVARLQKGRGTEQSALWVTWPKLQQPNQVQNHWKIKSSVYKKHSSSSICYFHRLLLRARGVCTGWHGCVQVQDKTQGCQTPYSGTDSCTVDGMCAGIADIAPLVGFSLDWFDLAMAFKRMFQLYRHLECTLLANGPHRLFCL